MGVKSGLPTVRKYMPTRLDRTPGRRVLSQRWRMFIRQHGQAIVACDFCVVVTATFQLLYVFVLMEHATRRVLHVNVTAHPTASWTLQQLREAIPVDHTYRFLLHDRDSTCREKAAIILRTTTAATALILANLNAHFAG
jgi:putative transposase